MIRYSLTLTRKADKDEADIYKHITENAGKYMRTNFVKPLFSFVIFSVNNLLLADPQNGIHH